MSEELKHSEASGSRPANRLAGYLLTRQRWSGPHSPGPEAWLVGQELSDAMDEAIRSLPNPDDLTVLAVGGYGHRQLSLHSDIDLLLLHDGTATSASARPLLYPLWDAGLKVGHALRTVRESMVLAREDLSALCSLLSARAICGPAEPLEQLTHGLGRLLRNERARLPHLLAVEEAALWDREPFAVQDPNLKESRGGLRTLDRLRWDRIRSTLIGEESSEAPEEAEARRVLIGVRTALHAVERRAADRFAVELRTPVGAWLQRHPLEVASEVYHNMGIIDSLSGIRFGRLRGPSDDPVAAAGRGVIRFIRDRWARQSGQGSSATPFSLARQAALTGNGRLRGWEVDVAGAAGPPDWNQGDRTALMSLLASGRSGWEAINALWDCGWLPKALPELSHLRGLPEAAPFHQHPTDAHLGRTIAEALAVAEGAEAWCGEVAEQIGGLDELLLAALLHDAGKGLGGDHSEVGAHLASSLLARVGFPAATGRLVGDMVRHHLLLPKVAFRRDLDDPRVIRSVAATVGDLHDLRVLTLLTVADSRATGAQNWNSWRSGLLRNLYAKVASALTDGSSRLESEERYRLEMLVGAELPVGQIDSHLAMMPAGYLLRFGSQGVAAHLRLTFPPIESGTIRINVIPGAPVATVMTASPDQPGLLALIAGVLSLHNLAILEARVTTRTDGVAIDTFRVIDTRGADMVGPARWPGVREDLEKAVRGQFDVAAGLARKRLDYQSQLPTSAPQVDIYQSGSDLTVEVRAPDRLGLLYDLATTFAQLGLDVLLAKIDTRAQQVVDVFTVRDPHSVGEDRQRQIHDRLAEALGA